jgi:DNA-binding GntR family transcriptional regulator
MSRRTRANIIRTALESDILTGALPPGAALDEESLAERFAVSRTPIREAIMQLLQDGLVEKEARRGTRVVKLDLHRLIQVFETTSELEGLCARFAARRIGKQELIELKEEHALGELALNKGDAVAYARHGRHFHYLVIKASHNDSLIETVNKIALHTLPYRRFQLGYEGRSKSNHHDHSLILDAIVKREEQTAYELMCNHVTVQGDVLADYISVGDRLRETG